MTAMPVGESVSTLSVCGFNRLKMEVGPFRQFARGKSPNNSFTFAIAACGSTSPQMTRMALLGTYQVS